MRKKAKAASKAITYEREVNNKDGTTAPDKDIQDKLNRLHLKYDNYKQQTSYQKKLKALHKTEGVFSTLTVSIIAIGFGISITTLFGSLSTPIGWSIMAVVWIGFIGYKLYQNIKKHETLIKTKLEKLHDEELWLHQNWLSA